MMKDENFYVVHGWMKNHLKLKGVKLELFAIIYGFSQDGKSKLIAGKKYLMESVNASKPAINKALNDLQEMKLICIDKSENNIDCNRYYVLGSKESLLGKFVSLGSKETLPEVVKKVYDGSKETLPNNNIDNINDNNIDNSNNPIVPLNVKPKNYSLNYTFEDFWELVPKYHKKDSRKCKLIFDRVSKDKEFPKTFDGIRKALIPYITKVHFKYPYIKNMTTWLNSGNYADEWSCETLANEISKQETTPRVRRGLEEYVKEFVNNFEQGIRYENEKVI